MYDFLLTLQYIGIILLIVNLIYIIVQNPSRLQSILTILTLSLIINFIGYLFEIRATNMDLALNSVKLTYCGKPFIILSMFLFVMNYCHINLPKIITYLLICIHLSITVLVFTCEHNNLFYTSIEFTQEGLFPHLVLGHGIIYILYTGLFVVYSVIITVVCFKYYKKVNSKVERIHIRSFLYMISVVILSFIIFLSGVTRGYDSTLIGYLIADITLSITIYKFKLFDTTILAKDEALNCYKDGIIVLDNNDNMLYINPQATSIAHSFSSKSEKNKNILSEIKDIYKNNSQLNCDSKIYSVNYHNIEKNDVEYGHMYILNDITDSYNYTTRLEQDVAEKTSHIQLIQQKITLGMADIIENRDNNTGGHVKRTSEVVKIFIKKIQETNAFSNLSNSYLINIIKAAPMHDLGKIAVSDAVLNIPGKFTPEEYEEMKTHAEKGSTIVNQILSDIEDEEFLQIATNIAHYHHEKWDGTGYPCGLKGKNIPLEARIMALADVFDALVSKRCYKEKMSFDQAFKIIEESLGSHFDKELGVIFLSCKNKLIDYYMAVDS